MASALVFPPKIYKKPAKSLWEKVVVAIGRILDQEKDMTWEKLPWQVQFLPIMLKYWRHIGKIKNTNPHVPLGGAVGYDKHKAHKAIKEYMPKEVDFFEEVNPEVLQKKINEEGIVFPFFYKTHAGERGAGVTYIQNEKDLKQRMEQGFEPFCIQAASKYPLEFGLSFFRSNPNEKFTIIDLTKKNGNAVIASISFGTTFTNQNKEITSQMTEMVEKILEKDKNVLVGRFDVRAESLEVLKEGKTDEIEILEMNYCMGQPLGVYDAQLSVSQKYTYLSSYYNVLISLSKSPKKSTFLQNWNDAKQILNNLAKNNLRKADRKSVV